MTGIEWNVVDGIEWSWKVNKLIGESGWDERQKHFVRLRLLSSSFADCAYVPCVCCVVWTCMVGSCISSL